MCEEDSFELENKVTIKVFSKCSESVNMEKDSSPFTFDVIIFFCSHNLDIISSSIGVHLHDLT